MNSSHWSVTLAIISVFGEGSLALQSYFQRSTKTESLSLTPLSLTGPDSFPVQEGAVGGKKTHMWPQSAEHVNLLDPHVHQM